LKTLTQGLYQVIRMKGDIGFNIIRQGWFNIVLFIIAFTIIILARLELVGVVMVINTWVLIRTWLERKFKLRTVLARMGVATAFILLFFFLRHVLNGVWAVVILTILGVGMKIYSSWPFIVKADKQIGELLGKD